jgi:tetratricopeptide (TPR) repeat protein
MSSTRFDGWRVAGKCLGRCAITLLAMFSAPSAWGHAELLLQLEEATKEIEKNPNVADLYIKRGELHRTHADWEQAFADYERALSLSPGLPTIDLLRGRLFLEAGWPLSARAFLDRSIARNPSYVDAWVLRARALTKLEERLAAAADYDRALTLYPEPGPDLFIERAQVLAAEGPEHYARALQGLDDAIAKMGPLVTLQLYAVDVELKQKSYDAALARIDKVAARSPRKETWLARRGEILVQAGRTLEAAQAYKAALAAMQTLPPGRRNVPAMLELDRRLKEELKNLERN